MAEIYVYPRDCDDFDTLGLCGALTPTSCVFTEVANGTSEIAIEHPIDELQKYRDLVVGNIIKCDVPVRTQPTSAETVGGRYRYYYKKIDTTATNRKLYKSYKGTGTYMKEIPATTQISSSETVDVKLIELGEVQTGSLDRYNVSFTIYKYKKKTNTYEPKTYSGYVNKDSVLSNEEWYYESENKYDAIEENAGSWDVIPQLFRITSVDLKNTGVSVTAQHIFYDLIGNVVRSRSAATCEAQCRTIETNTVLEHDFSIRTDVNATRGYEDVYRQNPVAALLDEENGICSLFGAEILRDNYNIFIAQNAGYNRGVVIEYGKNLLGVTQTSDSSETVAAIMPVGKKKNGDALTLDNATTYTTEKYSVRTNGFSVFAKDVKDLNGNAVFPDAEEFNNPKVFVLDLGDNVKASGTSSSAILNAQKKLVDAAVEEYVAKKHYNRAVTIEVNFIMLGDTEEYSQYRMLESVHLYDTVTIRDKRIGIEATAKVCQVDYNVLTGKMNAVKLGTATAKLGTEKVSRAQLPMGLNGEIRSATNSSLEAMGVAEGAAEQAASKIQTFFEGSSTSTPVGTTVGDLWFDIDDGNKLYYWNGTAWDDAQDGAIAQLLIDVDGKTTTFYGVSDPIAQAKVNDIWYDTENHLIKRLMRTGAVVGWSDITSEALASALDAAGAAQRTANGKIVTYSGLYADMPTAASEGDLFIATDRYNQMFRWSDSVFNWVDCRDGTIAQKNKTFYEDCSHGTSFPTATGIGDLCFDTSDNNHLYRWNGTQWKDARDTIVQKMIDANDGIASVYYTPTQPTGMALNDVWYSTAASGEPEEGKVYKVTSVNPLVLTDVTDYLRSALTATYDTKAVADSKIVTFAQDSEPLSSESSFGDLWIDTGDGNKMYRYNNGWHLMQDGGIEQAQSTANAANTAAGQAQTAAENAQHDIDTLSIGGRNMLLRSGVVYTTRAYKVGDTYVPSSPLIEGETYTISICANVANDVTSINAYVRQSYWPFVEIQFSASERGIKITKSATFTMTYGDSGTHDTVTVDEYVTLYRKPRIETAEQATTLYWIKIEKGSHATDWTPAPEDFTNSIESIADRVDGKTTVFYGISAPTNGQIRDVWYDTSTDPVTIRRHDGTGWKENITDATLSAALAAAGDAKSTADGKIVTYSGLYADMPTDASEGDLFIATDKENQMYRWSDDATPHWVDVRDTGIQKAQDTADSKVKTYRQENAPTEEVTIGDVWIMSKNGYELQFRWDGTGWVLVQDATFDYAKATATNQKSQTTEVETIVSERGTVSPSAHNIFLNGGIDGNINHGLWCPRERIISCGCWTPLDVYPWEEVQNCLVRINSEMVYDANAAHNVAVRIKFTRMGRTAAIETYDPEQKEAYIPILAYEMSEALNAGDSYNAYVSCKYRSWLERPSVAQRASFVVIPGCTDVLYRKVLEDGNRYKIFALSNDIMDGNAKTIGARKTADIVYSNVTKNCKYCTVYITMPFIYEGLEKEGDYFTLTFYNAVLHNYSESTLTTFTDSKAEAFTMNTVKTKLTKENGFVVSGYENNGQEIATDSRVTPKEIAISDRATGIEIVKMSQGAVTAGNGTNGAAAGGTKTITITHSMWNAIYKTYSQAIAGLVSDATIIVSPSEGSAAICAENNVRCVSQGAGQIVFMCDTIPDDSISLNLILMGGLTAW